MQLLQDNKHPKMWRIKWKDGTVSTDCYNLTRAKEIMYKIEERYKKTEKMINVGETWEFPIMGLNEFPPEAHWCVFKGESYRGSGWVMKTPVRASYGSLRASCLEEEAVNQ